METFKGTDKDMKCYGGFQYELGKTYVDDGAIRCRDKGIHSCEVPMDVLSYFAPTGGNRFFSGEATGEIDRDDDDSKISSSEFTLKAEIGIAGLIKAQVKYVKRLMKGHISQEVRGQAAAQGDNGHAAAQGDNGHAAAQGDWGHAAAQGDWGHAAAQGYNGHAAAQGYNGHAAAQGDYGHAAAQGDCGHAAAQGDWGHAAAQGDCGHAAAQGDWGHAAAQGDNGHAAAQGYNGHAAAQGDYGHAAAQGDCGHAAAQGYRGHAAAQGDWGYAEVHGKNSIAVAFGVDGRVMGSQIGQLLTLYQWELIDNSLTPISGITVRVDGDTIKPGVWYRLDGAEFVEADEE